jgi:hypothetical protein
VASGGDGSALPSRVLINGGGDDCQSLQYWRDHQHGGFGLIQQTGTGLATVNGTINITGSPSAGGHFVGGGVSTNALVLNGLITSNVQVSHREGFVRYSGGGFGYNSLLVTNTAQVGATDGISTVAVVQLGGSGNATLDLNGFDQALAGVMLGNIGANSAITGIINVGAKKTHVEWGPFDDQLGDWLRVPCHHRQRERLRRFRGSAAQHQRVGQRGGGRSHRHRHQGHGCGRRDENGHRDDGDYGGAKFSDTLTVGSGALSVGTAGAVGIGDRGFVILQFRRDFCA